MTGAPDVDAAPRLLEPPVGPDAEPFWDATRDRRLVLPWCTACERAHWFPRPACPHCLGEGIEWRPSRGRGEVYAASVQHKPGPGRDPARGPYVVVLVDLADGVRMMGNVVGCEPAGVEVGMPVEVAWHPLSDGRHLPMFARRPDDGDDHRS